MIWGQFRTIAYFTGRHTDADSKYAIVRNRPQIFSAFDSGRQSAIIIASS